MKTGHWIVLSFGVLALPAQAQDPSYLPEATLDVGYGEAYGGAASFGSQEQLYRYDDQERWKHGYMQTMPFYGGHKSFRPYNYHHVFSQAQTAAGWGMPATMPYSQQFWHRYANMSDLSRGDHSPVAPYQAPPADFDHYPKPINNNSSSVMPPPAPPANYQYGPVPHSRQIGSPLPQPNFSMQSMNQGYDAPYLGEYQAPQMQAQPQHFVASNPVQQSSVQQGPVQYVSQSESYSNSPAIQRTQGFQPAEQLPSGRPAQNSVNRGSVMPATGTRAVYPANSRQHMQQLQQSRQSVSRSGNVYQE